jgi:hypothetical protein
LDRDVRHLVLLHLVILKWPPGIETVVRGSFSSPVRRFSLVDVMGLIAALGIGFALARGYWRCVSVLTYLVRSEPSNVGVPGPREWAYACVPSLLAVTSLLWPLRLMPPRPRLPRCARSPGLVPASVAIIALLIALAKVLLGLPAFRHMGGFPGVGTVDLGELVSLRVVAAKDMMGPAIAVSWLILWLGGGWRPERSWIDRTGRAFGVLWIAFGIVNWVDGMLLR